nr:MAG TPA: hypothetical protein [Caudoviricetes sp.]DAX38090.1 MAG TPA: hypothetical protein [Caudoviricetes sp.]
MVSGTFAFWEAETPCEDYRSCVRDGAYRAE